MAWNTESNNSWYEQLDVPWADYEALELLSDPDRTRWDLIALVKSIADAKIENGTDNQNENRDNAMERNWRDWDGSDTVWTWLEENTDHQNFEVILRISMDEGKDIPYVTIIRTMFENDIILLAEMRVDLLSALATNGSERDIIKSFPYLSSEEVSVMNELSDYGLESLASDYPSSYEAAITRVHFSEFNTDNRYHVTEWLIGSENHNLVMERLEADLREKPDVFGNLPIEIRDIKSVALIAIQGNSNNFRLASQRLRGDLELTLLATKDLPSNLEEASSAMRNNPEVALQILANSPGNSRFIGEELMDNDIFVWDALELSGNILRNVSLRLRDNKDFVMIALQNSESEMLQHVSLRLRDDEDVARVAIEASVYNYSQLSARLRWNKELALLVVSEEGWAYRYDELSPELQGDRDIVLAILSWAEYEFLSKIPVELRGDREIVIAAIESAKYNFQHASEELRGDRNIALMAIRNDRYAFQHVVGELTTDEELLTLYNQS